MMLQSRFGQRRVNGPFDVVSNEACAHKASLSARQQSKQTQCLHNVIWSLQSAKRKMAQENGT